MSTLRRWAREAYVAYLSERTGRLYVLGNREVAERELLGRP